MTNNFSTRAFHDEKKWFQAQQCLPITNHSTVISEGGTQRHLSNKQHTRHPTALVRTRYSLVLTPRRDRQLPDRLRTSWSNLGSCGHNRCMSVAAGIPFGVIAPGRPVIPEFRAIDSSKCVTEIVTPREVDEVVFFLLPNSPVPPGHAAVLYYSVPNSTTGAFEHWEVLGAVAAAKPSGVFRTGWPTNERIQSCPVAQLGVSIESEDVVTNLRLGAGGVEDRKQFALKIAKDLFQFMSSFSTNTQAGPEVMVVPTNVLDRWITRFESKYNRDPNFMLKD